MSFLVIVCIVALVLGMLNRIGRTARPITRNNDNAHLFNNDDGFVQNKSINKEDLMSEIKVLYSKQDYAATKDKINKYYYYYEETPSLNMMMVMTLLVLGENESAKKYAENVMYRFDNLKVGNYLFGCIEYANNNFELAVGYLQDAMRLGFPQYEIKDSFRDDYFLSKVFQTEEQNKEDLPF